MKKIRPMWFAVAGAVVLGVLGWSLLGPDGEKATYRLERVDRGDVVVTISATGTLNAVTTVQVGSQVSGTIAHLYADFNSEVRQGQLLAQLDPTFLQATVSEQRANVERALAQVHEAERSFQRTSDLFGKSLVSQADMDAATATQESARATLRQTQATLERAEVNLRYATIRAPISGVVISRNVDVGQTVAASLQAPTLFTIANDLRKMQVEASVDEADIGTVQTGQHVTFRVDAFPDEEFAGVVSQIRLAPVVTQNVVTYTVIIAVDNPRQKLMPGMTATVSIEVVKKDNVLRVPVLALRFTPADTEDGEENVRNTGGEQRVGAQGSPGMRGTGSDRPRREGGSRDGGSREGGHRERPKTMDARIWVLEDGKAKPLIVTRGVQNTRYAEVESGVLKEGDEVIVGLTGPAVQSAPQGQNPLMPRMPGGGGGRRGGF